MHPMVLGSQSEHKLFGDWAGSAHPARPELGSTESRWPHRSSDGHHPLSGWQPICHLEKPRPRAGRGLKTALFFRPSFHQCYQRPEGLGDVPRFHGKVTGHSNSVFPRTQLHWSLGWAPAPHHAAPWLASVLPVACKRLLMTPLARRQETFPSHSWGHAPGQPPPSTPTLPLGSTRMLSPRCPSFPCSS